MSDRLMNCLFLKYRNFFLQGPYYGLSSLPGKFSIPATFHISCSFFCFRIQFLNLPPQRHSLTIQSKQIFLHLYFVTQSRQKFLAVTKAECNYQQSLKYINIYILRKLLGWSLKEFSPLLLLTLEKAHGFRAQRLYQNPTLIF